VTTPRVLAIMGSGETAPTMVSTHRALAARLAAGAPAVLLDTPYGFQENATELAERAREYFATSVSLPLEPAGLTRIEDADQLEVERGLRRVADAGYVFAGPGSPTYALRQWSGTPLSDLLKAKLTDGGIVTFSSAAALTLGTRTLPVYEIYKVGVDPHWLEGLDLLGAIGVRAVVVPHFDNAEGGTHDTRFCYMGERRLAILERELADEEYVLGVDEHTAIVIDVEAERARVTGKGGVTLRMRGEIRRIESGEEVALDVLRAPGNGATSSRGSGVPLVDIVVDPVDGPVDVSLRATADRLAGEFDEALAARDAGAAARRALALDEAIAAWAGDTLQSDDTDHARAVLRSMIARLADAAVSGLRNPRDVVGPWVAALLSLRDAVRADRRFDLSDRIRDDLLALGVEVRDTASGVEWHLGH
jgi:hypothetical protein